MAVIVFRCNGCNRLIQLRENERGVTNISLCTITEGCKGELIQTDRIVSTDTPKLAVRIPDILNRTPRNILFNHTQSIVSTVWIVQHNLATNPIVQVAVDRPGQEDRIEIEPLLVEIINENNTRITFDRPESGIAQFIARSSSVSQEVTTAVAEPTQFQLSNDGVLTLATLDLAASPLNVEIIYITSEGVLIPELYSAQNIPATESPWNDADTVVVKGKEYKIRTIDVSTLPLGTATGASFFFNDSVYPTADMFIPLAISPFNNADKIKRQLIFPEGIEAEQALTSFAIAGGELLAVDTIIEEVYPPVFII